MFSIYLGLYSVECTVNTLECTVYRAVKYTVNSTVKCTVNTLECTAYRAVWFTGEFLTSDIRHLEVRSLRG